MVGLVAIFATVTVQIIAVCHAQWLLLAVGNRLALGREDRWSGEELRTTQGLYKPRSHGKRTRGGNRDHFAMDETFSDCSLNGRTDEGTGKPGQENGRRQ